MKQLEFLRVFGHWMRAFPLSWLYLSRSSRLGIVACVYVPATWGLWFLFPRTHNGSMMFLPIVVACWLFRYRGLLVSLVLNGLIFQLMYILAWHGTLPDQAFLEGGGIGFGASLGIGLVACWLRSATEQAYMARQNAFSANKARVQSLRLERQATLAYEEQRKMNELKDQFILHITHELRTPLTMLGGSLDILAEMHEEMDAQMRAHLLQEARTSQEELVELTNRVLDASRVLSEIPLNQCVAINVQALLREVLARQAVEQVSEYTFQVQVSEQLQVLADPQLLRQVLSNLFSNIFKYVPRKTEVRIEAVQMESSTDVCLCVQDAGPGIPEDELPLLFEKFVRLKRDLAGPVSGTGLGLYICRRLTEAMRGRIWVESSGVVGEGSRFCLLLPSAASEASLYGNTG